MTRSCRLANQTAAQTRGYTVEELHGKKIYDLVPPGELYQRSLARLHDLQAAGIIGRFESVHVRKDGSQFSVEVQGCIAQMNGEKIFLGVARDITERQRLEADLRESEAKYRELVETANSIILRLDTRGNITFFNEFTQTFFGYREEEVIGRNVVVPSCPSGIPQAMTSTGNWRMC
jgi:PAS domain S-box-containing protein